MMVKVLVREKKGEGIVAVAKHLLLGDSRTNVYLTLKSPLMMMGHCRVLGTLTFRPRC
jgi:hypothetical protein